MESEQVMKTRLYVNGEFLGHIAKVESYADEIELKGTEFLENRREASCVYIEVIRSRIATEPKESAMPQPIIIPCELRIIHGGGCMQNRIVITASGEQVVDEYEQSLSPGIREAVGAICEGHARLMSKFGQTIRK